MVCFGAVLVLDFDCSFYYYSSLLSDLLSHQRAYKVACLRFIVELLHLSVVILAINDKRSGLIVLSFHS